MTNLKKRKDQHYEWFQNADFLYLGSRALFKYENPFLWFPAIHLIIQCVEQYLKTFLKYKGKDFPKGGAKGHNLEYLYQTSCCHGMTRAKETEEKIKTLNKLWALRYMDNEFEGEGLGMEELDDLDFIISSIRPQIVALAGQDSFSNLPLGTLPYDILIWQNKMESYFNLSK